MSGIRSTKETRLPASVKTFSLVHPPAKVKKDDKYPPVAYSDYQVKDVTSKPTFFWNFPADNQLVLNTTGNLLTTKILFPLAFRLFSNNGDDATAQMVLDLPARYGHQNIFVLRITSRNLVTTPFQDFVLFLDSNRGTTTVTIKRDALRGVLVHKHVSVPLDGAPTQLRIHVTDQELATNLDINLSLNQAFHPVQRSAITFHHQRTTPLVNLNLYRDTTTNLVGGGAIPSVPPVVNEDISVADFFGSMKPDWQTTKQEYGYVKTQQFRYFTSRYGAFLLVPLRRSIMPADGVPTISTCLGLAATISGYDVVELRYGDPLEVDYEYTQEPGKLPVSHQQTVMAVKSWLGRNSAFNVHIFFDLFPGRSNLYTADGSSGVPLDGPFCRVENGTKDNNLMSYGVWHLIAGQSANERTDLYFYTQPRIGILFPLVQLKDVPSSKPRIDFNPFTDQTAYAFKSAITIPFTAILDEKIRTVNESVDTTTNASLSAKAFVTSARHIDSLIAISFGLYTEKLDRLLAQLDDKTDFTSTTFGLLGPTTQYRVMDDLATRVDSVDERRRDYYTIKAGIGLTSDEAVDWVVGYFESERHSIDYDQVTINLQYKKYLTETERVTVQDKDPLTKNLYARVQANGQSDQTTNVIAVWRKFVADTALSAATQRELRAAFFNHIRTQGISTPFPIPDSAATIATKDDWLALHGIPDFVKDFGARFPTYVWKAVPKHHLDNVFTQLWVPPLIDD